MPSSVVMEPERDLLLGIQNGQTQWISNKSPGTGNASSQRSTSHRCRLVLFVLASGFVGFVSGIMWTISYLIKPVQAACSPPWSSSATIYGSSAMAAGYILSGAVRFCLPVSDPVLWLMLGIVMIGSANAVAGTTVVFCQQTGLSGEVIYVATYTLLAVGLMISFFTMVELALLWLPDRPGLAGGILPLSSGFGSLVISQIIIALRTLFTDYHIHQGTLFFCLGILCVIVSSPWLAVVSLRPEQPNVSTRPEIVHNSWKDAWALLKSSRSLSFSVVGLCAYTPSLTIMMYQEPLMVGLWNTSDPPVSPLSAILMASYLSGRALCLILSDKIGLKRIWLLSLLLQAALLLGLGVLVTVDSHVAWTQYAAIAIVAAYMVVIPVFKVAVGGLCHHLFGYEQRMSAMGLLCIVSGVAGIAGPIIIDGTYNYFGSYKQFLFGSAGLSFIGSIALLLINPAIP